MLEWLSNIINWIGNFIPRILHINATQEGVMFTRAKFKKIEPGIHIYLPLWSSFITYPVKRQTLNLPAQVLLTNDKKNIVVDVAVVYKISDIEKALVDTFDLEDTINDIAQGAVKSVVSQMQFDKLISSQKEIDKQITLEIKTELDTYGINVLKAFITNLAISRTFRIIQT